MTPSRWQQIEELYHAVQECEPSGRAALLALADPELRREVRVRASMLHSRDLSALRVRDLRCPMSCRG